LSKKIDSVKERTSEVIEKSRKTPTSRSFEFMIAGVPYKLRTNHDEVTVQELVDFINSKMNHFLRGTKNGSFQNAAVLTAMNLAEELLLLKKKASQELERLEEKTLKIAMDLENSKIQK